MTWTLALALLCSTAHADEATELRGRYLPEVDPGVITAGFLTAHPDLAGRQKGMLALDRNEPEVAARHLLAASRYGDKPSQSVLGEKVTVGEVQAVRDGAAAKPPAPAVESPPSQ